MSKKKITISLEAHVHANALADAKELGFDFSAYLTHLIANRRCGVAAPPPAIVEAPRKEAKKTYSEKQKQHLDDLLGGY